MAWILGQRCLLVLSLHLICSSLVPASAEEEGRDCREQEYKDALGGCRACRQCDAGQELSKECGFGYGEDARCVPCRSSRFKEDRSLQKCKPCLDCALINRFQKGNCSATSNAVCGDCLPGFYRKTKLSGFQDMECIPCGDPPPPYEPHCSGRVNLVPIPSVVTSPRDMALAAVICSALATVMLALLILCVIYCKRQLLEKKPSASLRAQDGPYSGAELSCLERGRHHDFPQRPCCQCHLGPGHTCGPVHLIPSLCCDDSCSLGRSSDASAFQSQNSLNQGYVNPMDELAPPYLEEHVDSSPSRGTRPLALRQDAAGEHLGPLHRRQEPAGGRGQAEESEEEESEEEGGSRGAPEGGPPERVAEQYEDDGALTEVLLPKQRPSSLEG